MNEPDLQNLSYLHLSDKLAQNRKSLTAFCMFLIIACAALGSTVFFMGTMLSTVLQLAGYLGIGSMNVAILRGNLSILTDNEKFIYSLIVAIVIFIFQAVFYFLAGYYNLFSMIANSCAFLMVYVIRELWRAFDGISNGLAPLWYYTPKPLLYQPSELNNTIPVRMIVQTEVYGRVEQHISFRAPLETELGVVFYYMMQEESKNPGRTPVDFVDADDKPYGWVFFTMQFAGWSNFLDPDASLTENRVKPNSVIIARRINEPVVSDKQSPRKKQLNKTV